jgi:uncharacterized protein YndB with AHSA1/START domain
MGREFEMSREAEFDADPEEVWDAIATGPGIDSWFMGATEVEGGEGGLVRTAFGGYTPQAPITAWEPGRRFAYRDVGDDGRFVAYEFLIEGRDGASTVLRAVTSGFLPGDDWEDELEAMRAGGELFHATLVSYLANFRGRTARPITAFGAPIGDWPVTRRALLHALGLHDARPGATVAVRPDGLPPIGGVVYASNEDTIGIRTPDAMYRFLRGFRGPLIASHHLFGAIPDADDLQRRWEGWLLTVASSVT